MSTVLRRLARPLTGAVILAAVLWWTGSGPLVTGLRSLDWGTLGLGLLLALATTVASAWRWQVVARGFGLEVDLRTAVAACYLSQLLNATLPGGVVGDVHRGLHHGRVAGDTGLALRAVAWERFAGQLVQAMLVLVVVLLLPSPLQGYLPEVAAVLAAGIVGLMLWRIIGAGAAVPSTRLLQSVRADLRRAFLVRGAWPKVVLASTVAVAGYVATYLLAARAVGIESSPERLVPLMLLVLVAAGLPLNVAGWGPREGMAAWSFGAAGLGAAQGVAVAVAYGGLVLVGTLPGAVVLMLGRRKQGEAPPAQPSSPAWLHARETGGPIG